MKKSIITSLLLFSTSLFGSEYMDKIKEQVNKINTKELVSKLKENPNLVIVDVRDKKQIVKEGGYIKSNKRVNVERDVLEFMIENEVKKEDTFVVHCYNGTKSLLSAKTLQDMGYKNVLWYEGSYEKWKENNLPTSSLDKYPNSLLYNKIEEVSPGVYTSIGETAPYRYESNGHNNNLGFVVGEDSVLVFNAGSSYLLASSLHREIKKITNKPVKYVVLENSQGHAILGSNYWKEQGATIIAHKLVEGEIKQKGERIYNRMKNVLMDKFDGTKLVYPDKYFEDNMKIDLGNKEVELKYFGYAHERSDIGLWLEKESVFFAGDLAFNNRVLPIFEITETLKWLEVWEKIEELNPKIVVPGHGETTDLKTVRKYTQGYLLYLREKIEEVMDNDGGLIDAYKIDMSPYEHLDTYKELGRLNISRLWQQMEFE